MVLSHLLSRDSERTTLAADIVKTNRCGSFYWTPFYQVRVELKKKRAILKRPMGTAIRCINFDFT
jgi:hypothetical protein